MSDPIPRLNAALEGRYRIERQLGEGGMATVYLADDLKHERKVALKLLKPELAAVVGAERFLAEIKTTANLQHPHILPLHDSGEADGLLFYVMPYVQGESLRERLEREHQLPVDDAVRIGTNMSEALDYAHRQGVIHRDIKPANIMLQDGKPVITDFGIALAVGAAGGGRLTETGLSLDHRRGAVGESGTRFRAAERGCGHREGVGEGAGRSVRECWRDPSRDGRPLLPSRSGAGAIRSGVEPVDVADGRVRSAVIGAGCRADPESSGPSIGR
jgi:serine/threonine protein kinase